jgi:hypothetical protein
MDGVLERLRIDHQRNSSTYNRCRNPTCPIRMSSIYTSNAMDHGIIYSNGVLGVRVSRIVFNHSITKVCLSQDSERCCWLWVPPRLTNWITYEGMWVSYEGMISCTFIMKSPALVCLCTLPSTLVTTLLIERDRSNNTTCVFQCQMVYCCMYSQWRFLLCNSFWDGVLEKNEKNFNHNIACAFKIYFIHKKGMGY